MGRHALLATLWLAAACDPFAFDDLEDEAPVHVLAAPDGQPSRSFPRVIASFEGTIDGAPVSRLAASSGSDSPFVTYRVWDQGRLILGDPLYDGCDDPDECDDGAGAALAGVPVWRAGSPDEGRMCVLVGAPTAGTMIVRCETGGGVGGGELFTGPAAVRFGASAASLGAGNPVGVAVLGAPDADGGSGALYRVPDGAGPVALGVPDEARMPAGMPRGKLGTAVAAARLPDGRTLVAGGAPDAKRVVVLVVSDAGGGAVDVSVRACIDGTAEQYGEAIAWGDVTGDDVPDLFVGSELGGVDMFDGADLPDPGGCAGWGSAPRPIACPEGVREGLVSCDGAGFGAALAVGDVDADGLGDLLVGAPEAAVDGVAGAGAVFLIPGESSGLDVARADALTLTSPEAGDNLGAAVTTAATHLDSTPRAEPVASAVGRSSMAVFLCSGLQNDTPEIGTRCVAR